MFIFLTLANLFNSSMDHNAWAIWNNSDNIFAIYFSRSVHLLIYSGDSSKCNKNFLNIKSDQKLFGTKVSQETAIQAYHIK